MASANSLPSISLRRAQRPFEFGDEAHRVSAAHSDVMAQDWLGSNPYQAAAFGQGDYLDFDILGLDVSEGTSDRTAHDAVVRVICPHTPLKRRHSPNHVLEDLTRILWELPRLYEGPA
jgi:hypothetical protein